MDELETKRKRVILSMGGKGGVGKTSVMAALAEWFDLNQIPATLLDLDTENKTRGSLTHFFGCSIPKVNIHTPAGLDAFIDHLADGAPVILADMGAGSGQITYEWFERMYPDVADAGIGFTTLGVVTAGLPGLLLHDCRRTTVRNLVRAGVSDKIARAISGHNTRSVFNHYNIVDERDLRDATAKIERSLGTK